MSPLFKRFFIACAVLIILAALFTWKWVFQEQEKSVGSKKADITISSDALLKEFESNEMQANSKFLNKTIAVKGNIASISTTDKDVTLTLKKTGTEAGVTCGFDKSALNTNAFKTGQYVTVKGICSGYLMDVVLNRCSIEK